MTTGLVKDTGKTGRPLMSQSEENVTIVQEMFNRSPAKSTCQAAHESRLTRYAVCQVLQKELLPMETPLRAAADTRRLWSQNGVLGVDAGLARRLASIVSKHPLK
ncbi:hypothetical protein ANN_27013 [Periplaneta americana]|uniref:Uncharacterized protein n=1 Tax=Periplaneta americana TaxID=6978 RepID=A0ABQ8RX07_PERAM|nr:hypothetical protein ANN_27013 [Periplaneta americana]